MKAVPTAIPEVLLIEPKVFGDARGFFFESYNRRALREALGRDVEFVQDNHSRSRKGVLRGLHYQIRQPQGKLIRVLAGRIFDAVVDIIVGNAPPTVRIDSPADGTHFPARSIVDLTGSAIDPEDGTAACDQFRWDIRLGHNAHSHPLHVRTGCNVSFPALLTGNHAAGQGTFYIVELEYTDAGGPTGEPALTSRTSIRIEVDPA